MVDLRTWKNFSILCTWKFGLNSLPKGDFSRSRLKTDFDAVFKFFYFIWKLFEVHIYWRKNRRISRKEFLKHQKMCLKDGVHRQIDIDQRTLSTSFFVKLEEEAQSAKRYSARNLRFCFVFKIWLFTCTVQVHKTEHSLLLFFWEWQWINWKETSIHKSLELFGNKMLMSNCARFGHCKLPAICSWDQFSTGKHSLRETSNGVYSSLFRTKASGGHSKARETRDAQFLQKFTRFALIGVSPASAPPPPPPSDTCHSVAILMNRRHFLMEWRLSMEINRIRQRTTETWCGSEFLTLDLSLSKSYSFLLYLLSIFNFFPFVEGQWKLVPEQTLLRVEKNVTWVSDAGSHFELLIAAAGQSGSGNVVCSANYPPKL